MGTVNIHNVPGEFDDLQACFTLPFGNDLAALRNT